MAVEQTSAMNFIAFAQRPENFSHTAWRFLVHV
jgi:hypothetical protein